MRNLIAATLVVASVAACAKQSSQKSTESNQEAAVVSPLADATTPTTAGPAAAYTWQATYLGQSVNGPVSVGSGSTATINVAGLTSNQTGDLSLTLVDSTGVAKYQGTIPALVIGSASQLRRLVLAAAGSGAALCDGGLGSDDGSENFGDNFSNNTIDNSNFGNGSGNGLGRFDTGTATIVTGAATTTGVNEPKSATNFQILLVTP